MTDDESVIDKEKEKLITFLENELEIVKYSDIHLTSINCERGMVESTQPGDKFKSFKPDGTKRISFSYTKIKA